MNRQSEKSASRQNDIERLRNGEAREALARENSFIEPLLASGVSFRIVSIGAKPFGRCAD